MANEISLGIAMNFSKASVPPFSFNETQRISVSGTHRFENVQDIGTAAGGEALVTGADLATLGVAFLQNEDTTNYIEVGVVVAATFYPSYRINATEYYALRLAQGVTHYARSNTASCKLRVVVIEN